MINFTKPTDSPSPYCVVDLSDGTQVYESNSYTFWRELKKFCEKKEQLFVKKVTIVLGDNVRPIKYRNIKTHFMIYNAKMSINSNNSEIKKGYGVICCHPGNIVKTYISWFNDNSGVYMYDEAIRGSTELYEKELGISTN